MIDKAYWEKIAAEWKKQDDGIDVPEITSGGAENINPDDVPFDQILDSEIDDILSDLGLDDI